MNRRQFIGASAAALTAATAWAEAGSAPVFRTGNARWQATYDAALRVLAGNVRVMPRYPGPVLIEGSSYLGIWMECGPHESLLYRKFRPDVARHSHLTFFALQAEDGQLPANNKATAASPGWAQIQMVVPIAATAWDVAKATGDQELLEKAYAACSRWDGWLMQHRNTRGTGLTEGFCTYDTGMDNSPRWKGMPNACPGGSAKNLPAIASLPRLCPDLSATTYGARIALTAMAKALGKSAESSMWEERAASIREAILQELYVAEDAAFYDVDAQGKPVKINCDILSRVCGEHVPDQKLFDTLWERQIHRPQGFWPEFPMPSSAIDEPSFVRPIPRNSWGGAAQSLTAMRAPRWMDHYGRAAEFASMMNRWCEALQRDGTFRQQIDPVTGATTPEEQPNYSPSSLVMVTYTWRLAGVHEQGDEIWWNVRCGHPAANLAAFTMPLDRGGTATLQYRSEGAEMVVNGRVIGRVQGIARVVTTADGKPRQVVGIAETQQTAIIRVEHLNFAARKCTLGPNQRVDLL